MADQQPYLDKARAFMAGRARQLVEPMAMERAEADAPLAEPTTEAAAPRERSERSEESPPPRAVSLLRWRATLSPGLLRWAEDDLLALAQWALVVAFGRGGATNFRRYLPPSLAHLDDHDLHALVEWPMLAQLEAMLWARDPETAAQVSRGAHRLAGWWTAQRQAGVRDGDHGRS